MSLLDSGGESTLHGWLVAIDHSTSPATSTTHEGGWLFNPVDGIRVHPSTEADFDDQLAAMMHRPLLGGRAFDLGTIVSFLGNAVKIGINYVLDLFIPYSPPAPDSCDGPTFDCNAGDLPCDDQIADQCEGFIDQLPGASQHFKKCMKGRCGCGGSTFRPIRVTCSPSEDCGPCGGPFGGCSLGGEQNWYCQSPSTTECFCSNTVFHEMAHSCGSLDDPNCETDPVCPGAGSAGFNGACRIGNGVQELCCALPPG